MFAKTFRAHANANGWKKALDGETELPESEAGMLAATGAALEAVKRNNSAAAAITLAMNNNTSMFPILAAGETAAYPDGVAHLMWQALTERYSPIDDLSPVEKEADLLDERK